MAERLKIRYVVTEKFPNGDVSLEALLPHNLPSRDEHWLKIQSNMPANALGFFELGAYYYLDFDRIPPV